MIVSTANYRNLQIWITLILSGLLLSGCGSRLPPEERARARAEQEYLRLEKDLSRIHPIGKDENRRFNKEEAYHACNQKSQTAANEAAQAEEIRQTIEYKNKSGGGFIGGMAQGLSKSIDLRQAKDRALTAAMRSCLIDYGYLMK